MNFPELKGIRKPVAAGRFYPAKPTELRRLVEALLAEVPPPRAGSVAPKALIVPHAGYPYSGPVAATAYAQWVPVRDTIRRIVLLGPAHFVQFEGLALPAAEGFETPLGRVPVDAEAVRELAKLPQVTIFERAHAMEHSLEVQLPFLQVLLSRFSLVPLAVGEVGPEAVSRVLEALWDGPQTRVIISSDLSHYLDWAAARALDQATAEAIEALKPEAIGEAQACGRNPVRGLLYAAHQHGLQAKTLDLRNSGDTGGGRERVVGYGAFALARPA